MSRQVKISICLISLLIVFITGCEIYRNKNTLWYLHRNLRHMTGVIDTVCRNNNIVYWITAGTLLGSHRDGDIIRHDDDVDLAVPIGFIDKLKQEITKNGLQMNKFANGLHKISDPEKCGFIDVFEVALDGDYYTYIGKFKKIFPNEKFEKVDNFKSEHILGTYLNNDLKLVPLKLYGPNIENTELFLDRAYGHGWREPKVTHFHTFTNFISTYWYSVFLQILLLVLLIILSSCLVKKGK